MSAPAAPNLPDTCPKLLLRHARERAARPAMRAKEFGIWRTWSWAEVLAETSAIAAGLAGLGVARGARVAIIGDNRPQLYWAVCAAQMLGAIPVPIFQEASAAEVGFIIDHAEIDVAIAEDQEQVDKLLAVRARSGRPERIVFKDGRGLQNYAEPGLIALAAWGPAAAGTLDDAIGASTAEGPAVLLYTSGTTGASKGVLLSHANVIATARALAGFDGLGVDDEILAYLPMAWVGDHLGSHALSLVSGCCVSCPESGETLLADLREIGPSCFIAPPRILQSLLGNVTARMAGAGRWKLRLYEASLTVARRVGGAILDGQDVGLADRLLYWLGDIFIFGPLRNALGFSRIRRAYVVGDAMGPDIFRFYRALGLNLKQSYGLTEASGFVCVQADGAVRAETVGAALPGVELRLGDGGEILVRGPGVFQGYYRDAAATGAVATGAVLGADGWLHTGDTGVLEADGQLRVVDRAADVGRLRDGAPFTPKFLENKLKFFPYIREAIAFGDGQEFVACLIDIDAGAVGGWAERAGLTFASYQELAAKPEVMDLLAGCVSAVNRDLAADPALAGQAIRRFLLLPKELDADDGELTRMRKIRRAVIAARYASLVAALYGTAGSAHLHTEIIFDDGRTNVLDADLAIRAVPA